MTRHIQNYDDLAKSKRHEDALDIIEAGYHAIDTAEAIKENVKLEGSVLRIKGQEFDLSEYENTYIVGCGKVACKAAATLEEILAEYITAGAVIGINGGTCKVVKDYEGTHPLPSEMNFKATQEITRVGGEATEDDLVIAIVGGGGSALLCSSQEECDKGQELYKAFLDSGGNIEELNTVRRHISDLKGGGLAKALHPATVVSLIFSDVPGDDCAVVASGPTYKDETTIEDAEEIVAKYKLNISGLKETPKEDKYFEKVHNIMLVNNHMAISKMLEKAKELGYEGIDAGCDLYHFPEEISKKFQDLAKENSVIIAGGETRLVVPEDCSGKGGRNDFLSFYMAFDITDNQIFASFASDGHDNTDAAGGLVDSKTKGEIEELGIDVERHKKCLDSYPVLEKTGNLIFTGYIEANVSDLMVLLTFKDE